MRYIVKGEMRLGKEIREFTKEIEGESERYIIESVYSTLGSQHRLKRDRIKIIEVKKVNG